jgi:putative membrane protein
MKKLITAIICASCAMAAADVIDPAKEPPLAPAEVKFLREAGQSSVNVLKVATLGSRKCQNPALSQLSVTLVADHTAALEKAKAIAQKKKLSLPTLIDEATALVYKNLEQETGHEFDTAFIAYLDKSHLERIKAFEKAQRECQDAGLKGWIDETLLLIRAHYERLKKLK